MEIVSASRKKLSAVFVDISLGVYNSQPTY